MTTPDKPSHKAMRMREKACSWQGPAGMLEGIWTEPVNSVRRGVVLICHPHPLYGGNMHNKVVTTMAQACDQAGYATVRFNFRGVGSSEGRYDRGQGEYEDALSVLSHGRQTVGDVPWLCAGFSFGAYIASRVACQVVPSQLWLVAPPVTRLNLIEPMPNTVLCPTVVVQGLADEVIPPDAVLAWAHDVEGPCELVTLDGGSHFFHGRLVELRQIMLERMV